MTGLDSIYFHYLKILIKEVIQKRVLVVVVFSILLLAVEVLGLFHQPSYETSTIIYADQQNIIAPLLEGQAEITRVENHTRIVQEVIYSPRMLTALIQSLQLLGPNASPEEIEEYQNDLRGKLRIAGSGPGFIKISSRSKKRDEVFNIVTKAAELFIKDASETKRNESREAFLFIDKQVKGYKDQLVVAEEKLKQFKEQNMDGSLESVNERILNLKDTIADIELSLDEANIRVRSLRQQLADENQFVTRQVRTDEYQERLRDAQSRLATLRLSYTETYPDIIVLKEQIDALQKNIVENQQDSSAPTGSSSTEINSENPVYQNLRENLSDAEVDVQTLNRRLNITNQRLETEFDRLKNIAAKDAQLAELVRDYDVTKNIYETMLDRKEKARLSMTLDIEGQGVTYKIQEPAAFPLNPAGITFFHFALLAPFIGAIIPIGLIMVFIILDPRVRLLQVVQENIDVPVLGVVPHISTRLSERVFRKDVLLLGMLLVVVLVTYLSIGVLRLQGIL
ncbi:MAG: hypothetical protein MI976_10435 [Pseudomonadales bacterium]|nr:hypothetical protein [Pseudomonadales bacterium]